MRNTTLVAVFLLSALSTASGYAATQAKPMPMPMPMRNKPAAAKPAAEMMAITFRTDPATPKAGSNRFDVTVKDATGKPVTDADVTVTFVMAAMPQMNMPEMRKATKLRAAGGGAYTGPGQVPMAGHWDAVVSVKRAGQEIGSKRFGVDAK